MSLIDRWIVAYPQDLEARAWHARVQAWTNHWSEAESEYRTILQSAPDDVDVMAGLADVLTWQKRYREALAILERACGTAPVRNDCRLRLARVQQRLGLSQEATSTYREVLARDKDSREAQAGLAQLREGGAHELRVGFESGLFNYAQNSAGLTAELKSRWTRHWSSRAAFSQYRLFGESATRLDADATLRFGRMNALTVGGAAARDAGVVPKSEARFEYSRGFDVPALGPVRGIEASYQQRWAWYQGARLLVMSPGAILYFPKDWDWLIRFSATNSRFSGAGNDWKPGGMLRWLTGNLRRNSKAVVTEPVVAA